MLVFVLFCFFSLFWRLPQLLWVILLSWRTPPLGSRVRTLLQLTCKSEKKSTILSIRPMMHKSPSPSSYPLYAANTLGGNRGTWMDCDNDGVATFQKAFGRVFGPSCQQYSLAWSTSHPSLFFTSSFLIFFVFFFFLFFFKVPYLGNHYQSQGNRKIHTHHTVIYFYFLKKITLTSV